MSGELDHHETPSPKPTRTNRAFVDSEYLLMNSIQYKNMTQVTAFLASQFRSIGAVLTFLTDRLVVFTFLTGNHIANPVKSVFS
ncbi:hypothetical protein [Vibrio sp. WXL210]|uniref:hypothetical protein n=1 Tax=Vibrio sp. WXL210 TaxID=3450709 RepID=UPI003EC82554